MASVRIRVLEELQRRGIETNASLPEIEPGELRPPREVASRIIQLYGLIGLSMEEVDQAGVRDWLMEVGVFDSLEDNEKKLFEISQEGYSRQQLVDLSWMRESLYALGWSGLLIPDLHFPNTECSLQKLFPKIPPEVSVRRFVRSFRLRDPNEILYEADLHYCLHWALRESDRTGEPRNRYNVILDVVIERRRAFEWLVSTESWGEILLNT